MSAPDLPSAVELLDPKPWYRSKTIVGLIVAALAKLAEQVAPGWSVDTAALTDLVLELIQYGGLVLAWYGRVVAERPIRRRVA